MYAKWRMENMSFSHLNAIPSLWLIACIKHHCLHEYLDPHKYPAVAVLCICSPTFPIYNQNHWLPIIDSDTCKASLYIWSFSFLIFVVACPQPNLSKLIGAPPRITWTSCTSRSLVPTLLMSLGPNLFWLLQEKLGKDNMF